MWRALLNTESQRLLHSPTHSKASLSPIPWPWALLIPLQSPPRPPVTTGDRCLHVAHSRALSPFRGEPCPAVASLWASWPRRALAFWREVPAPAPAPSSWLQLPGEAGEFPLAVNDLQLLDTSPGAGRTPGAQGLLRAC